MRMRCAYTVGNLQRRLSNDTNDSEEASRGGVRHGKGGKKGRSARQRAFESSCPAELRSQLQEVNLQGLVLECAATAPT